MQFQTEEIFKHNVDNNRSAAIRPNWESNYSPDIGTRNLTVSALRIR